MRYVRRRSWGLGAGVLVGCITAGACSDAVMQVASDTSEGSRAAGDEEAAAASTPPPPAEDAGIDAVADAPGG